MYIYLITNLINDKVYIGQSSKSWTSSLDYYGSGTLIKQAIEAYGIENFNKTLLQECQSKEELNEAECYWIDHYSSRLNKELYNITKGGIGGVTYTKGSLIYEQCKHKLGHLGKDNPGSREDVINKRVHTWANRIEAGKLPTSGIKHGNYKGKMEKKHDKYKGGAPSVNAKQVCIDDVNYQSLNEASRTLGISPETISRRCKSNKYKNYNII